MSYALHQAVTTLKAGKLLAYPTEAVFGLGCVINNPQALKRLRNIKGRSPSKGFIIICASIAQLQDTFPYLNLSVEQIARMQKQQSHPTTWIIPFTKKNQPQVAQLLVGNNHSIAVRIPQHPLALALCEKAGPIVSSSANVARGKPAKKIMIVRKNFRAKIDFYLSGETNIASSPSQIIDIQSGRIIRAAKK
jgi:L-threonylcarbamoyladenylate synthase